MFASKTPRDLNRDPFPFVGACDERHDYPCGSGCLRIPRPEFDRVQHNEVNPILVAYRKRGTRIYLWLRGGAFDGQGYSPDQIDHARRVLSRLAALESNE